MKKLAIAVLLLSAASVSTAALAQKRPMTFEDLAAVRNVSDPQISPTGTQVLYALRTTDLTHNRRTTVTYLVPAAGGAPQPFPSASVSVTEARWSPDGKWVAYIAGDQLWIVAANGSGSKQLTTLSGGVSGPVWSPTGEMIAFVSGAYADCSDDACNATRAKADAANPVKAHVTDQLMYRHWNAWEPNTRSHIFVVRTSGGAAHDVTQNITYDVPPGPFAGSEAYAFSPDGKEIAYTGKDQRRQDAWSTDLNIYTVSTTGGSPAVITAANHGADVNPVYSADGKLIFYQSQSRPGFESDRGRLMAYDRGSKTSVEVLPAWDRTSDTYSINSTGDAIVISAADAARNKLFRLTRNGSGWMKSPQLIVGTMNNVAPSLSRDGKRLAWLRDATDRPAEVWVATLGPAGIAGVRQLTHENDALTAKLALNPAEDFWFKGAGGDSVQGM